MRIRHASRASHALLTCITFACILVLTLLAGCTGLLYPGLAVRLCRHRLWISVLA